jgi:hypothetical protein
MTKVVLADALGLVGLLDLVSPASHKSLFDNVTRCFERGELQFPREVADELDVIARNDFLSGWHTGLGDKRDLYTADIALMRPVMKLVADAGFPEGVESLDNKDPAILHVARLGFALTHAKTEFCVLSTDVGKNPLVPTMEQLCVSAGWELIDPVGCAAHLDLLNF